MHGAATGRIAAVLDETHGLPRQKAEAIADRIIAQCANARREGLSVDAVLSAELGAPVDQSPAGKLATYRIILLLELIEGNFNALPDRGILATRPSDPESS